jgi:ribonuclease T2
MLDLLPAPRLVFQQWDKHGTCSGLSPRAYFDHVRKARAVIKIPPEFIDVTETLTVSPAQVEEAFIKVNPGLTNEGISINCDRRRLREVRVCMTKEFAFRDCKENERRACRREQLVMPPVRGRAAETPAGSEGADQEAEPQPAPAQQGAGRM